MLQKKEFTYKNSKIKVLCDDKKYFNIAFAELARQRSMIEAYILKNKDFLASLEPVGVEDNAPKVVRQMAEAGKVAAVGPMASVAGTLAESVCKRLISKGAKNVIIENGGDIFCSLREPALIGIFAGRNKLIENLAFEVKGEISVCSSSSKMGHSISFGDCDLATVFSDKGNIADAAVTAVCNRIKTEEDVKAALEWGINLEGVHGIIAVKNNKVGMIGNIPRIVKANDSRLKEKVTRFGFYSL